MTGIRTHMLIAIGSARLAGKEDFAASAAEDEMVTRRRRWLV